MAVGRPRIKIDWDEVITLFRAHATTTAIARLLNMHPHTLRNAIEDKYKCSITDFMHEKKEEGVALVKLSMYNDALSGAHGGIDRIFWLKNCAGWADKQTTTHEGLPPVVQIALAPGIDLEMSHRIENFFNGIIDDNEGIRKEPAGLPERSEADR